MRREADLQFQESFVQRPGSFSPAAWEKRFGIQCLEGVFFFFLGGGVGFGVWGLRSRLWQWVLRTLNSKPHDPKNPQKAKP